MRGRVEAKRRAIPSLQCPVHVVGFPLPTTNHCETAHHRAYLMVEKAASGGGDVDFLTDLADAKDVQRLYWTVRLALRRAEGREVVASNEVRSALSHCVGI